MRRLILVLVLLHGSSSLVFGQDRQTDPPSQMGDMSTWMDQQAEAMLPWMEKMLQSMSRAQFDVLAEPDMAPKLAQFTRNYYEALVEAGFQEQQALELTKSVEVPAVLMSGQ